jgi:hypothetical protein
MRGLLLGTCSALPEMIRMLEVRGQVGDKGVCQKFSNVSALVNLFNKTNTY